MYLADDLRHGRPVALKVLRDDAAQILGRDRFRREIETVARLHHPNILPLYDSGEAADLLYYTMPYVEGEASLRHRLEREGRMTLGEAVRITAEVADALQYAHDRGVIHRDVKPDNILLVDDHAILADFGIALLTSTEDPRLTSGGGALGTPIYMSPEQAFGEARVDLRSDVYGLACVLYEMLVGTPPFAGITSYAILARKTWGDFTMPSQLRPELPRAVDAALRHALAPAPEHRFRTTREFADAVQLALGSGTFQPLEPPAPLHRVIAVLPFATSAQDLETQALSDGVAEDLIHALARVPGLRVVARGSAFAMRGERGDVREIARKLGADMLLEGSVRRAGDRLRIMVQLVDGGSGLESWSERFDRPMGDVFAIQDEIAQAAAQRLTGSADVGSLVQAPTADLVAYEWFLKGRHFWNRRREEDLRQAVRCFDAALALDRRFRQAAVGRAEALATLAIYGAADPAEAVPAAMAAAEEGVEHPATRSEALAVRGCLRGLHHWVWTEAERDFEQAMALTPRTPTPHHWYAANLLMPLGRFAEAREALQRAHTLDPLSPSVNVTLGLLLALDGDPDGAQARFADVLAYDAGFMMAHYFAGVVAAQAGDAAAGVAALIAARAQAGGSPEVAAALAWAQALAGARAEAKALVAELRAVAGRRYVSPVLCAPALLALDRPEQALDALEAGYAGHALDLAWIGVKPAFAPLHGQARFEALRERLGVPRLG